MKRFLLWAALMVTTLAVACDPGTPPGDHRPQVLIIGDSISLGYTPIVADLLKGKMRVTHSPGNAKHTWNGAVWLDTWLGSTHWDVIQFNWGLWDMCYHRPGRGGHLIADKVTGAVTINLEEYRQNLERLVSRLEKTGAVLIWASTTEVPEGDPGRFPADAERYNAAAAQVMREHGIRVNDLYVVSRLFPPQLRRGPGDVHFTTVGYGRLARAVAKEIGSSVESPR